VPRHRSRSAGAVSSTGRAVGATLTARRQAWLLRKHCRSMTEFIAAASAIASAPRVLQGTLPTQSVPHAARHHYSIAKEVPATNRTGNGLGSPSRQNKSLADTNKKSLAPQPTGSSAPEARDVSSKSNKLRQSRGAWVCPLWEGRRAKMPPFPARRPDFFVSRRISKRWTRIFFLGRCHDDRCRSFDFLCSSHCRTGLSRAIVGVTSSLQQFDG